MSSSDKPIQQMWEDFIGFVTGDGGYVSANDLELYRRYFYLGADAVAAALIGPPPGMTNEGLGTPEWRAAKKAHVKAITDEILAFRKDSGLSQWDELVEEILKKRAAQ